MLVLLAGGGDGLAQGLPGGLPTPGTLPPAADPARALERPPAPPPSAAPEAQLDFQVNTPRRSSDPRAVDQLRFAVKDIIVDGATQFPRERIEALIAGLRDKMVGLREITAVAEAIEALYRGEGFILSRAFVPPQKVGDGIFRIQVVEGYVKNVLIEGGSAVVRERVAAMVERIKDSRPTRIGVMERALLLANDLPGAKVQSVLRPSDTPGAADIVVTVEETPLQASLSATNRGSKYTGPWSAQVEVTENNALDLGEQISLGASATSQFSEQKSVNLRSALPLGTEGLIVGLDASYSRGAPGDQLKLFDTRATSYATTLRASYPVLRGRLESLFVEGSASVKASDVETLGVPFSRDRWRTAELRLSYSELGFLDGATAVSLGLTRGLGLSGGSVAPSRLDANGHFTKFSGEVRRIQPLFDGISLSANLFGQYSLNPLLSGEEFGAGGARVGRGYDPSEITGEHGLGAALELRHDWGFEESWINGLQLYGFYDTARIWNKQAVGGDLKQNLASTGGGLRFGFDQGISLGVEYAQPLTKLSNQPKDKPARILIDFGIRF